MADFEDGILIEDDEVETLSKDEQKVENLIQRILNFVINMKKRNAEKYDKLSKIVLDKNLQLLYELLAGEEIYLEALFRDFQFTKDYEQSRRNVTGYVRGEKRLSQKLIVLDNETDALRTSMNKAINETCKDILRIKRVIDKALDQDLPYASVRVLRFIASEHVRFLKLIKDQFYHIFEFYEPSKFYAKVNDVYDIDNYKFVESLVLTKESY